ncbi:MAG: glycerol-3-phosphate 1-O-acyltransferase PlsY [Lachnospiraceae bacterium]|nr:glycerol-3-phosphate 1-O-acyltransferase PlsY [Lachnospiraceae bacterium]
MLARVLCLLIGYGLGSISTSYLYGKAKGIDVREHGSGNAGTTNTLRVMGRKAGAIVLAGDMLKTFLAILLTWLIFHWFFPDMDYLLRIYTGAGVILGHDYPFYMKFKGGKGIACSGAMILSFYWGIIPASVVIFFGIFFLTHYVSLASIFLYLGFMAQLVIFGQSGLLGMSQPALIEMYIVAALLTALALFQHRENIKRLIKGEERQTILKKTKKDGELGELAKEADEKAEEGIEETVEELAAVYCEEEKTEKVTVIEPQKEESKSDEDDDSAVEEVVEEIKEEIQEAVEEIKEEAEEFVEEVKEKISED